MTLGCGPNCGCGASCACKSRPPLVSRPVMMGGFLDDAINVAKLATTIDALTSSHKSSSPPPPPPLPPPPPPPPPSLLDSFGPQYRPVVMLGGLGLAAALVFALARR